MSGRTGRVANLVILDGGQGVGGGSGNVIVVRGEGGCGPGGSSWEGSSCSHVR